jgi:glutamine synthetase
VNLLADAAAPEGLSTLARRAIAGVVTHLPGLLGLTTPSVNSFRRLQPHYWSSAYTAWGIENREAAVRVPSRYWDDEAGSTNLELKASDSSANAYIALGGVIAAALDSIERELDPGDPVNEDPGNLTDAEREKRGIRRFPMTASEALDELERDTVLTGALGAGLGTEYLKVRRAEAAAYGEKDEAFELDQHFFKY